MLLHCQSQSGIGTTCKTMLLLKYSFYASFRATGRACNPNLRVKLAHARLICSQHSFGLPLRMIETHRPQSGHAHLGPLSREVTQSIKSQSPSIILARTPQLLVGTSLYIFRLNLFYFRSMNMSSIWPVVCQGLVPAQVNYIHKWQGLKSPVKPVCICSRQLL